MITTITTDEMHDMPWTRELMTAEQLAQWIATRKDAGAAIDIETCDLDSWYCHDLDVYGLEERKDNLPEEEQIIGRNYFVRSPDSNGWVHVDDLPLEISESALRARMDRDWVAYCDANPDDPRVQLAKTQGIRIV